MRHDTATKILPYSIHDLIVVVFYLVSQNRECRILVNLPFLWLYCYYRRQQVHKAYLFDSLIRVSDWSHFVFIFLDNFSISLMVVKERLVCCSPSIAREKTNRSVLLYYYILQELAHAIAAVTNAANWASNYAPLGPDTCRRGMKFWWGARLV